MLASERYSERYFSKAIQAHYQRTKSQAIAYLFTVGAKALAIESQNAISHADAVTGINIEAEIKQEMDIEEKIRLHKRKINERIALPVHKLSRGGQLRVVFIKIHTDKVIGSTLKWKSKFNHKKHMTLDQSVIISSMGNQPIDSVMDVSSYRKYTESEKNLFNDNLPLIRFEHTKRQLTIRFQVYEEMLAFLQCVESVQPNIQFNSDSTSSK